MSLSKSGITGSAPQITVSILNNYDQLRVLSQEDPSRFSRFYELVSKQQQVVDFLKSIPSEVFVPTNEALNKLGLENFDTGRLKRFISYHAVNKANLNRPKQYLKSMDNERLLLKSNVNAYSVQYSSTYNGALLSTKTTNGHVFILENDRTLFPPPSFTDFLQEAKFLKFAELVQRYNISTNFNSLQDVTILVPTDGAFGRVNLTYSPEQITEILMNHIVKTPLPEADLWLNPILEVPNYSKAIEFNSVGNLTVKLKDTNDLINIVTTDYLSTTGFIHSIDQVLIPTKFLNQTNWAGIPDVNVPLRSAGTSNLNGPLFNLILLFFFFLKFI
jgi:uncharacterized surface protein with fasciclin (FAS1) repeats